MRQDRHILLGVIAGTAALACAACFNKRIENPPPPAPVVQVNPPVVATARQRKLRLR
jgi:hypothetical protein